LEKTDMETAEIVYNMGMPEKNIFDAKFTGGKQKIGAIDYDPDAFEAELKEREEMENDRMETEQLILEDQLNNKKEDDQKKNLESANQSSKDEETYILNW
jgi:hypothetical protein